MRFILYTPKGVKTGGPEAIHQLNYALKELGHECYLLATWGTSRKSSIPDYEKYKPVFVPWWSLKRGDVVIIPEYFSRIPYYISQRVDSLVYWWLSVDNCPFAWAQNTKFSSNTFWSTHAKTTNNRKNPFFKRLLLIPSFIKFEGRIVAVRTSAMLYKLFSTRIELSKVIHIFQSAYAKEFVRSELKLEGLMVSDYTRQKVELSIKESKKVELNKKLSGFTIVYNPSKGLAHVSILEKILEPKVTFIPLQGFTYGQLLYLFDNADLYLDLGSLPGKDRLPRESILAGCPIMITTWGAGYNSTDFPVPNKYKLRMDVTPPREAAQSILNILELGKSENLKMQKYFQDLVSQEKAIFYKEVCEFANLFVNP